MIDYKKETTKMIAGASKNLANFVAGQSFEFWERKDFRLYIEFSKLPKVEQDRIFNELEVSLLGLFILHLDNLSQNTDEAKKLVFNALKTDLPMAFVQIMADLGIEEKYLNQWKVLIDIRLKEYREHLKITLNEFTKIPELQGEDEEAKYIYAIIQTITIDCISHIRRGKVEKNDPLWRLLRKWLISVDANLAPMASL